MLEPIVNVACPYCGELVDLVIDVSAGSQSYVEDCNVCCQPMEVTIEIDARGGCHVDVKRGDV